PQCLRRTGRHQLRADPDHTGQRKPTGLSPIPGQMRGMKLTFSLPVPFRPHRCPTSNKNLTRPGQVPVRKGRSESFCEPAPNRDPAEFCPILLITSAKLRMGGVPIGADRDPAPKAICKTAQYLEPVYRWGPASVLKHTLLRLLFALKPAAHNQSRKPLRLTAQRTQVHSRTSF